MGYLSYPMQRDNCAKGVNFLLIDNRMDSCPRGNCPINNMIVLYRYVSYGVLILVGSFPSR